MAEKFASLNNDSADVGICICLGRLRGSRCKRREFPLTSEIDIKSLAR